MNGENDMNFCGKCGSQINEGAKFCKGCGASTSPHPVPQPEYHPIKQPAQQLAYKPYQSTPAYQSGSQANNRTSNKMVGIIACSAVAIIVIISIILISNGGGVGHNSIVGSWVNDNGDLVFTFYEDDSCESRRYPSSSLTYKASANGVLTIYDMYDYPYIPLNYLVQGNKLFIKEGEIDTKNDNFLRRR